MHCWAKTALKRIFLIGEYPQGLKLSLTVARKLSPFSWAALRHRNTLLPMWIMEGKIKENKKTHQTPKHAAQTETTFAHLLWSSDAITFPRSVAFFPKIFLKRKLGTLSMFFSVQLEVCYRYDSFVSKQLHSPWKWRRK